jgi:hypothetical protein
MGSRLGGYFARSEDSAEPIGAIDHSFDSKFNLISPRGYEICNKGQFWSRITHLNWIGYGNLCREAALREVGLCDPT